MDILCIYLQLPFCFMLCDFRVVQVILPQILFPCSVVESCSKLLIWALVHQKQSRIHVNLEHFVM